MGGGDGNDDKRALTQKVFSNKLRRAEKSTAEQEHVNSERRANGNYQLALHVMKRDGDDEIVVNYLKAAARDGHVEAMWRLGCAYDLGDHGLKKDEKAAVEMYRNAADGGSASAQFVLAVAYDLGMLGLEKDVKIAFEMYRSAADGGSASAQRALGVAYEDGQLGLEKDDKAALEMYRKSSGRRIRICAVLSRGSLRIRPART